LKRWILARDENRCGAVFRAFLLLHRLQRNLNTSATRRFVNAYDLKWSLKKLDSVADVDLPPIFPFGIDDRFVAGFQLSSFANRDVREVCVLVVFNAVDQTLTKTGVTLVKRLSDRSCGPHALYRRQFRGVRRRNLELRATGETDRTRGTNHDLGADV